MDTHHHETNSIHPSGTHPHDEPAVADAEHHGGHDHGGHGGHQGPGGHGDHVCQFRRLLWTRLGLAIQVVIFNEMFAHIAGCDMPADGFGQWLYEILGTGLHFWGRWRVDKPTSE